MSREEPCHLGAIPVQPAIILVVADPKVAVGVAEHVFLLGNRALHICSTGHVGVRHVENGETHAVQACQATCDLAPIVREHLHVEPWHSCTSLGSPAIEILPSEAVIAIRR
jgi:hypothetical protein